MKLKYFFGTLLIGLLSLKVSTATNMSGQLNEMDIDRDGSVSFEEFNSNTLNRFSLMDLESDGTLSKDEFLASSNLRFEKMDLNSDGVLNRREIRKSLKQARKVKKTNDVREKKQPKPFIKQ